MDLVRPALECAPKWTFPGQARTMFARDPEARKPELNEIQIAPLSPLRGFAQPSLILAIASALIVLAAWIARPD